MDKKLQQFRELALQNGYSVKEIDEAIKQRQTQELVNRGVISVDEVAKTDPGIALRATEAGIKPKPTADELKDKQAKAGVSQFMDEMKGLYNVPSAQGNRPNEGNSETLALGKEGTPSMLTNLSEGFKVALNQAPDAKTYKRLKKGFIASLKDITGDTGVLTEPDAERLLGILPEFGDTPESARKAWESIDRILGGEKGIGTKYDYAKQSTPGKVQSAVNNGDGQIVERTPIAKPMGTLTSTLLRGLFPGLQAANVPVVSDLVAPRAKDVLSKLDQGKGVSADDALGVAGEYATNASSAFLGGGKLIPKMAVSGAIHGATTPGASASERVQNAAVEGATGAVLGAAGKVVSKLSPFERVPIKARQQVAQEFEKKGVDIGSKNLQKITKQMIADGVGSLNEKSLIEKLANGEKIKASDAIDLMSRAGKKTFTKGGDLKSNLNADYYDTLREALREEFTSKMPEVIKFTKQISNAKNVKKFAGKAIFPTAVSAGVGIPLTYAISKLLGQKGGSQ